MILWGENDPWIPLAHGKALHQRIPKASFLKQKENHRRPEAH